MSIATDAFAPARSLLPVVVADVFDTQFGLPAIPGTASPLGVDCVSAAIDLQLGAADGRLELALPEALAARLAACWHGGHEASGVYRDLAPDAVGELANLLAGGLATRLGATGIDCRIGVPVPRSGPALAGTWRCDGAPFFLQLAPEVAAA